MGNFVAAVTVISHGYPSLSNKPGRVDKKGNDQELIQSNSTSWPRHHTRKEHKNKDGIKKNSTSTMYFLYSIYFSERMEH